KDVVLVLIAAFEIELRLTVPILDGVDDGNRHWNKDRVEGGPARVETAGEAALAFAALATAPLAAEVEAAEVPLLPHLPILGELRAANLPVPNAFDLGVLHEGVASKLLLVNDDIFLALCRHLEDSVGVHPTEAAAALAAAALAAAAFAIAAWLTENSL